MHRLSFEEFEIDMDLFTLSKNSEEIRIGPRALDLLICLVRHRDRVVEKEFRRPTYRVTQLLNAR